MPRIQFIMAFSEDIRAILPFSITQPIQLIGENRVVINGHKGVLRFSNEELRIKMPKKIISVKGKELKIIYMSKAEIFVSGEIEGVFYSV